MFNPVPIGLIPKPQFKITPTRSTQRNSNSYHKSFLGLQLQADRQTTVTMLCLAGLQVLDKKYLKKQIKNKQEI